MLEGTKVTLRPLSENDLPFLQEIHNDMELKKNAMIHPFPVSDRQDKMWIDNILCDNSNKSVYLAVEDRDSNHFAGYVTLKDINWINRNCNFGIIILPQFQNKGYGKEATILAVDYAFLQLNLLKVQLEVIANNEKAISLYKKIGFTLEGTLQKQFYMNGTFHDTILMAVYHNG